MKRPTVGIVTSSLELALTATGALPMEVETATFLSWGVLGLDGMPAFGCDLTLIGADLARECPVRAITGTVYVVAPDQQGLPVTTYTDARAIGAVSVLVLSDPEDRARLWRLAHGLPATEGSTT